MSQNVLNNYTKGIRTRLYNANYFDFMLYGGDTYNQSPKEVEEMVIADFSDMEIIDNKLYSSKVWSGATNEGVKMEDIGLTGLDNGFIQFRKDRITNEEFLNLLFDSKYEIESGDTRLFLTQVTGNTLNFKYPLEYVKTEKEKYVAYKGGFHQGFFKLEGFDYQVLPNKMTEDLFFHFELRPRTDYEIEDNIINVLHTENEGIFFYIGCRAENKFWPFYKTNEEIILPLKKIDAQSEGYFDGCGESGETYNINENNVVNAEWISNDFIKDEPIIEPSYYVDEYYDKEHSYKECKPIEDIIIKRKHEYFPDDYFVGDEDNEIVNNKIKLFDNLTTFLTPKKSLKFDLTNLNNYDYNSDGICKCKKEGQKQDNTNKCCFECGKIYFDDEYFNGMCLDGDGLLPEEYIQNNIKIDVTGKEYTDSLGHEYTKKGYYEITTDNKFITFNNTKDGYNVDTWPENATIVYTQRQDWPNINYFLLMDQTPTGYTVDSIEHYNESHQKDYNIYKDLKNNVFCLRVTKNGAIGYKYGVFTCENENKYEVIEEYSKDNIIKQNEWNSINVRFVLIEAPNDNGNLGKMRIMIYANGFLVFVSKELNAFNFRKLDEINQKQEGVPYNISLGGGSQGLLETIVPNYYAISDYVLPIERDFCGSFIGDIKSFKIYSGFINYSSISNYLS